MSHFFTTPGAEDREFVLGQELRVKILTTGAETEGRHDLVDASQPAGSMTPLHLHTRYEERLWVLSGSVTVWAGSEEASLKSGDFATVPLHVPHAIKAGADGARLLNITSPAGFAELIARAATPARLADASTELDFERFLAVCTELGDVVLGPPGSTPADLDENGQLRTPPAPPAG
ncbi:cupin domain-containing protein [Streptomyces sp. TS71-3]|uniref:cupin domain-containing protein n=1 Tax=Streptomyces sp. TS71-3 TaxID=2733862 RepID=UPI001B2B6791|nr:cupin domain-containing protein [Streptomyces sp. TS71-3]GHJ42167.1 hypothetical protein Sm713_77760 [Streptomyces sp. TS71-3]